MSRPRGRPPGGPGAERNREGILGAARELFAEKGFERTTMRSVATRAGVDAALIHHYFGTKRGLLLAALRPPEDLTTDVRRRLVEVRAGSGEVGVELVRAVVTLWDEHPEVRHRMIALIRVALVDDDVAESFRTLVVGMVSGMLGDLIRPDRSEERIALAVSQTMGLAMSRFIIALPPIAEASADELASTVGVTVHRYLTGDL